MGLQLPGELVSLLSMLVATAFARYRLRWN